MLNNPKMSSTSAGGDLTKEKVENLSPMMTNFQCFREQLDERVNLNEGVVKASRDITIESKRLIFHLHRYHDSETNKEKLMQSAGQKIQWIMKHFRTIATLLYKVEDPATFARSYTNGLQEFIEAISFKYLLEKERETSISNVESLLLPFEEVQKMLIFQINDDGGEEVEFQLLVRFSDYILGIADTTGEAMRMCIKQMSCVRQPQDLIHSSSFKFCAYIRMLHSLFTFLQPHMDLPSYLKKQFANKLCVLESSLKKCEDQCSQSCMSLHECVPSFRPLGEDPFDFSRQLDDM